MPGTKEIFLAQLWLVLEFLWRFCKTQLRLEDATNWTCLAVYFLHPDSALNSVYLHYARSHLAFCNINCDPLC